jgi:predicted outer membrane repeat protein
MTFSATGQKAAASGAIIALLGCLAACTRLPLRAGWEIERGEGVPEGAVAEASILAGGCHDPEETPYHELFDADGMGPEAGALPPGIYGFEARLRDERCRLLAIVCLEVELPTEETVRLVLEKATAEDVENDDPSDCLAWLCDGGECETADGGSHDIDATGPDAGDAAADVPETLDGGDAGGDAGEDGAVDPECLEQCQLPHAVPDCSGGGCRVGKCDDGWLDCNKEPGCETRAGTDENCSACGDACGELDNVFAAECEERACVIDECVSGYLNCDLTAGNGCEHSLADGPCLRANIFVDKEATGENDGTSWEDAFISLSKAVNRAGPRDRVGVKEGLYDQTPYPLRNGVKIYGGFDSGLSGVDADATERRLGRDVTVIHGSNSGRCLTGDAKGHLDGFTIRNCTSADGNGGAIDIGSSSGIVFDNCIFRNNTAAGEGGAIYGIRAVTLSGCEFRDNSATFGGALGSAVGNNSCTDCLFMGNDAASDGGAVNAFGGFSCDNCLLVSNTAGENGGAIWTSGATVLRNTTLASNRSGGEGPALFLAGAASNTLGSSISWDNRPLDGIVGTYTKTDSIVEADGDPDPLFVYGRAGWYETIEVDNSAGGALNDYAVRVDVDTAHAEFWIQTADRNDIRVTEDDGETDLDFWVEIFNATAEIARLWIEIPTLAAGEVRTLRLQYGAGYDNAGSIDDVFLFGDTFSTRNTVKWGKIAGGGGYWSGGDSWHNCGVTTDDELYCWGYGGDRVLGVGDTADRHLPTRVMLDDVVDVSTGRRVTCAAKSDGSAWCWGQGDWGTIGDGNTGDHSLPQRVVGVGGTGFLSNVIGVAESDWSACGLLGSGEVRCWGYNSQGELGDGTVTWFSTPREVIAGETGIGNLGDVKQVAGSHRHFCALLESGHVVCWGAGDWGKLGNDTSTDTGSAGPVYVHDENNGTCTAADQSGCLDDIVEITVGTYHACARDAAGQVYCWGDNGYRQLGLGNNTTDRDFPVKVLDNADTVEGDGDGVLDTAVSIGAGRDFSVAVLGDGRLVVWGHDEGLDTYGTYFPRVKADAANDFESVQAGTLFACAIRSNGIAACFGRNTYGAMGRGFTSTREELNDIPTANQPDRNKWQIDAMGWSVGGGKLTGWNTTGRLRSRATFDASVREVVSETRYQRVTAAGEGIQVNGLFAPAYHGQASTAAFGLLAGYAEERYYYRDDATWQGSYTYGASQNSWTRSQIFAKAGSAVTGTVQRDIDGAAYAARDYTVDVDGFPVMLGHRYDAAYRNRAYEANWDFVFVRKHADPEPVVTPGNDPMRIFVSEDDYRLSHVAAGQAEDSPAIDSGSGTAAGRGLDDRTTRTDDKSDTGTVDMGYHYAR